MVRRTIALDARKLARPRVGIGQYTYELVRRLPALAPEFEFLLLTDYPLAHVPKGCRQVVLGYAAAQDKRIEKFCSPWWMNTLVPYYLRRTRVDLFHATNFVFPLVGQCRCVTTVHDLAFITVPEAYDPMYRCYLRLQVPVVVRRAKHIITVSGNARDDLVEILNVRPDRVTVIHHGVDEGYSPCDDETYLARIRSQFGLPERFVLHVGVVEARKNIEVLLKAGARLLAENLLDAIVLAGMEGRGSDAVRRTVAELRIEERVRFLGYVPQEAMHGLYSLARVFVMPSWYEGFGMPVLEAMACGTPVIASSVSSLPEVVGDGALLVSPNDAASLEQTLRNLLTNSHLWIEMREKGLNRAREFSWSESAARHLEVYRKALRSERSSSPQASWSLR